MPFSLPRCLRTGLAAAFLLLASGSPQAMAVAADAAIEADAPAPDSSVKPGADIAGKASEIVQAGDLSAIVGIALGYGNAELSTVEDGDPVIVGEVNGVAYQLFFLNCADDHTGCTIMNFYAIWDVQDVAIDAINGFNRTQPFNKAYLTPDNLPVVELNLSTVGGMTRGQLDDAFERWTIALAEFPREVLGETR